MKFWEGNVTEAAWKLKYSSRVIEALGLLLIFAVTALRVIAIDDLGLWDESFYLSLGVEQSLSTGQPFTQGGTYFDAYWITSKFLSDPVVLYYFMRVFSAFVHSLTRYCRYNSLLVC